MNEQAENKTISQHSDLASFSPALCVLKLGSAVLTTETGTLDSAVLDTVAQFSTERLARGQHTMIVSSGAVALGIGEMQLESCPKRLPARQALAAIGQSRLMAAWRNAFAKHDRTVAQILVSADDFRDRRRYLNMRYTLDTLFEMGAVPIFNENDTVTVDELRFGENDGLAQLLAIKMMADCLVFLTNVGGLYEKMPDAGESRKAVAVVPKVTQQVLDHVSDALSAQGSGGMLSKLQAAREATKAGIHTMIVPGKERDVLGRLFSGEGVGTLFPARSEASGLSRRKRFIAFSRIEPLGRIWIDDGAVRALVKGKKSLLPAGVTRTDGEYERGQVIEVRNAEDRAIARGLSNFGSSEVDKIKGRRTDEIEAALGSRDYDEIIHRDNLVMIDDGNQS